MKRTTSSINKNVYLLGLVSLFTDVSSEMIFSVFAVFFTIIIGASAALLGLVEGIADFASTSLDYVSGYLSDKEGKRKKFAILGYSASTAAKTLIAFSNTVFSSALFRIFDRFGKSVRGPPRDAWIASLSDKDNRGISFGIHKALDKSGAIIGPIIAYLILDKLGQSASSFNFMFKVAFVPAVIAVLMLLFLKDKPAKPIKRENIFSSYKKTTEGFRHYLYTAGIFSLAYFSFGFLLLKAYTVGFAIKDIILLYALFNIAFVIFSVPIGRLGDIIGRKKIIILAYVLYAIMCAGFVFAFSKLHIILLFIIFGMFYAIDEGQSKAYISDLESKKRATAIGLSNFVNGLIYLPASLVAGFLWTINPNYAFIFAGIVSVAALVFFVSRRK